jgi:hypothetical protein
MSNRNTVITLSIVITLILNAMNKEQRNTTGLNLVIPADLSARLSHKVIDMRSAGIDITKSDLILKYAKEGLKQDQDGDSEPISNPGIDDRDGLIETR